ncbi:hypothetical protein QQF64_026890, partial [Cirrhinus molitorella]
KLKKEKSKRKMGKKGQRLPIQHLRTGLNPDAETFLIYAFIDDQAEAGECDSRLINVQPWLDARCRGVRSANAYILVYDICCVESFEYVKMIRQQIVDSRVGSSSEVPILVVGSKRDLQRHRFTQRRAVSVLVKKTWKCGYVECSAKYNWHVLLLFKELLGIAVARGLRPNHTSIRLQGALHRNRCSVM